MPGWSEDGSSGHSRLTQALEVLESFQNLEAAGRRKGARISSGWKMSSWKRVGALTPVGANVIVKTVRSPQLEDRIPWHPVLPSHANL